MVRCARAGIRGLSALALALTAMALAGPQAVAAGHDDVYLRGELDRLYRQAWDYYYRNPNRNVFRSSRHFSPTGNVFRSSRHYQRRLAESYAGFPLRSTFTFTRTRGDGQPRAETISFAHPRRHPAGPVGFGFDLLPAHGYAPYAPLSYPYNPYAAIPRSAYDPEPILRRDDQPRQPIEMVALGVTVEPRAATQTAVLRTVKQADGTVRTIISSVPIAGSALEPSSAPGGVDDAWRALAVGDYDVAAKAFKDASLDEARGAEAMCGYGIVRALQGDYEAAVIALERALVVDENIPSAIKPDRATVRALQVLLEQAAADEAPEAMRKLSERAGTALRAIAAGGELE